jgi:hypothetical protein
MEPRVARQLLYLASLLPRCRGNTRRDSERRKEAWIWPGQVSPGLVYMQRADLSSGVASSRLASASTDMMSVGPSIDVVTWQLDGGREEDDRLFNSEPPFEVRGGRQPRWLISRRQIASASVAGLDPGPIDGAVLVLKRCGESLMTVEPHKLHRSSFSHHCLSVYAHVGSSGHRSSLRLPTL